MSARDRPATRIALLELGEERRTAREGHALLDEKRMLLAARILARLERLRTAAAGDRAASAAADAALVAALDRHGLHGVEDAPVAEWPLDAGLAVSRVLGIELPESVPAADAARAPPPWPAADPSPELEACAAAWRERLRLAAGRAALETSLWRLADEYARTERRTAAIEHVLLPELQREHAAIEAELEAVEREEAVRARRTGRRRPRGVARCAGGAS